MDYYNFAVTEFEISQTRAHTDTLWLSHAVYADGDMIASSGPFMLGDFNNGDFHTRNYVPGGRPGLTVVINDPQVNVSFIFQLVNAGHGPSSSFDGRISSTFDALSGIAAGLQAADQNLAVSLGSAAIPVALTLEAFADIYAWLTVDCDGPVAVDQISGPRYAIDAWADDDPNGNISFNKDYPGTDTPEGYCNHVNSDYQVQWHVQHYRGWQLRISDDTQTHLLKSTTGVSAAAHNGGLHVFGVMGADVMHARTFAGRSWYVDPVKVNVIDGFWDIPVSAVSFNDRLYVFGLRTDGSIWPQAYTTDGGSWVHPTTQPAGLTTKEPIATAVFGNRLYVFARSAADNSLQVTSTSDLIFWTAWAVVPATGLAPSAPVAAAALGDRLYIFGVHESREAVATVVVSNATSNGTTWSGWQMVEANARPEGQPNSDEPLDVAATTFDDRVYIASRWQPADTQKPKYIAVNFSADGDNWSGWREPPVTVPSTGPGDEGSVEPSHTPGLAGVGNHLYILVRDEHTFGNDYNLVRVY
jgi:hypothetical protein